MNIVVIGAHPDDPEFFAGASMAMWAARGDRVTAVSLTDGRAGHHVDMPDTLAMRRRSEADEAARRGGYSSLILKWADGELEPSLEVRRDVVRIIREAEADVVFSHRPWDYHPDHRYAAMLVQDAAFMVTVPHFCPETPALRRNPVFMCMMDRFTRPAPLRADLPVDVDGMMDIKWSLLDAMTSQFYEWLPWLDGQYDKVPSVADPAERADFLRRYYTPWLTWAADQHRDLLCLKYGARGRSTQFAEIFEVSEYGRQPDNNELRAIDPLS